MGIDSNKAADIRYNHVYELLVQDEYDILGQFAYAVYKQQKVAEIKRFIEEEGRQPTKDDLLQFVKFATSDEQLRLYRKQADFLASNFVDNVLSELLEEEKEKFEAEKAKIREEKESEMKDMLRSIQPRGFSYGMWQSVCASVLVLLVGFLLLFGVGGVGQLAETLYKFSGK